MKPRTTEAEQAVKELFDKFYQALCAFAASYVGDRAAAADIVQESFVKFWERQTDFDNTFKSKAFLYLIVRNRCLNALRDRGGARHVDLSLAESEDFFRNTLIEDETYRIFYDAVDRLSPAERRVIDLSLEGLRNAEIAARLGIAESTVHSTKKLAYKRLRESLRDYYYLVSIFLP
ncbi:MAG: sigma-70 family RNA polymerase sigma factor [Rikenellaceae bacterium]|nr:sigma-70 family RNA polymerase sigma factor [Rikenellaceae bacterium]MCL2691936.1 sigma-70 family RNA polymerase sigma factor [Rikenellaceae bacterium]